MLTSLIGNGVTTFFTANASYVDNTPQNASGTLFPDGELRTDVVVSFTDGGAVVVNVNLSAGLNIANVSPIIVAQMNAQGYPDFNVSFFYDQDTFGLSVQVYDNTTTTWQKVEWDSAGTPLVYLLTASGGGTFCLQNPFVTSISTVPLNVIMNSTSGYSYLVTGLYIFSLNRAQILASYTMGRKNANGNIMIEDLDGIS